MFLNFGILINFSKIFLPMSVCASIDDFKKWDSAISDNFFKIFLKSHGILRFKQKNLILQIKKVKPA